MSKIENLREIFNRRSDVAIKNYKYQLEQEKKRFQESNLAEDELRKRIELAEKNILVQEKAIIMQSKLI